MENVSEKPVEPKTLQIFKNCARDALGVLGLAEGTSDPDTVVSAIDEFVYQWQKGKRPSPKVLEAEDAPYIIGSLWGEQLIKRFGWEWAMVTFHDHGDSSAPGVFSPDRGLAVYPIHFLTGCFENPGVDATILLSYNMLAAGKTRETIEGREINRKAYFNLMEGVRRIVPRD